MDWPTPEELEALIAHMRLVQTVATLVVLVFVVVCGTPVVPNQPKYHIYL